MQAVRVTAWARRHSKDVISYGIASCFFFISFFLWTGNKQYIDGGDVFWPVNHGLLFSKITGLWWPDQLGTTQFTIGTIPVRFFFMLLQAAGLSAINIQRVFLAAGFGLSSLFMFFLAKSMWRSRVAAWIAAVWYPCGHFYSQAVPNENNVVALACIPALAFFAIKTVRNRFYIIPFLIVSLALGFLASNPPTLLLAVIVVVAIWCVEVFSGNMPLSRTLSIGLTLAICASAVNLWWLAPTAGTIAGNSLVATGTFDWQWVLRRSDLMSVMKQTSFWGYASADEPWRTIGMWFESSVVGQVALLATPILALSVLVFKTSAPDRKKVSALVVTFVVSVLLAKGLHDPLSGFNSFLYLHLPGMFLFREPIKFVMIACIVLPLLAAASFKYIVRSAKLPQTAAIASMFLAVPMITGTPLLTGWAFSLGGSQARLAIPPYWQTAMAYVNKSGPDSRRVLLLPEDETYQTQYDWGLSGIDRIAETSLYSPVVRLAVRPSSYLANRFGAFGLDGMMESLRLRDPHWFRTELQRLSIGTVIVRRDLTPSQDRPSFAETRWMLEAAGAKLLRTFGALDIYRTTSLPPIGAATALIRSCAAEEDEHQIAMRLPARISLIRSYGAQCQKDISSLADVRTRRFTALSGGMLIRAKPLSLVMRTSPMRWRQVPPRVLVALSGPASTKFLPQERGVAAIIGIPLSESVQEEAPPGRTQVIFRLPGGSRVSANYFSDGKTDVDLRSLFEGMIQRYERSVALRPLAISKVTVEAIASHRGAERKLVALTVRDGYSLQKWSIESLRKTTVGLVRPNETVYIGKVQRLSSSALVDWSISRWWRHARAKQNAGWLIMRQAYSDYWQVAGAKTHAVLDGSGNAWYVPYAGTYEVESSVARSQGIVVVISLLSATSIILVLVLWPFVVHYHRRKARV